MRAAWQNLCQKTQRAMRAQGFHFLPDIKRQLRDGSPKAFPQNSPKSMVKIRHFTTFYVQVVILFLDNKKPLKCLINEHFSKVLKSCSIRNYFPICAATSAAKSSSFFSIPSPTSNLTISTTAISLPRVLPASDTYCAAV